MAHLYYKFGTMGATKTRELLAIDYNYRVDNGLKSLVLTPYIDNRAGLGLIRSRDGGERQADLIVYSDTNLFNYLKEEKPAIVLADEAQFFSKQNIIDLARVVDFLDIPVMAYGLKNDAFNQLFPGSEALLLYADKIEEVKTICRQCGSRATMVFRLVEGSPVFEGEQIQVGDEEYIPCCRRCYLTEQLK